MIVTSVKRVEKKRRKQFLCKTSSVIRNATCSNSVIIKTYDSKLRMSSEFQAFRGIQRVLSLSSTGIPDCPPFLSKNPNNILS